MHDYKDRAMFEPEPANDDATEARKLIEGLAAADHSLDGKLALVSAISLIATLLFAVFLISRI